jgi:hypothetical protein
MKSNAQCSKHHSMVIIEGERRATAMGFGFYLFRSFNYILCRVMLPGQISNYFFIFNSIIIKINIHKNKDLNSNIYIYIFQIKVAYSYAFFLKKIFFY